jgi:hypothetical protein
MTLQDGFTGGNAGPVLTGNLRDTPFAVKTTPTQDPILVGLKVNYPTLLLHGTKVDAGKKSLVTENWHWLNSCINRYLLHLAYPYPQKGKLIL